MTHNPLESNFAGVPKETAQQLARMNCLVIIGEGHPGSARHRAISGVQLHLTGAYNWYMTVVDGFLVLTEDWKWLTVSEFTGVPLFICLGEDHHMSIPLFWVLAPWSTVARVDCGSLHAVR